MEATRRLSKGAVEHDILSWIEGALGIPKGHFMNHLSIKERILILLHRFGRQEQFEVYKRIGEIPGILTQKGMAEILQKHISEVQTAIKGPYASLLDQNKVMEIPKGFIKRHSLRIRGVKYRYHLVYVLTEKGNLEAERLLQRLRNEQT